MGDEPEQLAWTDGLYVSINQRRYVAGSFGILAVTRGAVLQVQFSAFRNCILAVVEWILQRLGRIGSVMKIVVLRS